MKVSQYYGNLIWTNHVLSRLGERGLTQQMAWETFNKPDVSGKANEGAMEYKKKYGISTVTVIAKQNEKREWIIISAWINPPLPGTEDERKHNNWKAYQKAGWGKKILLSILSQLGLR